MRCNRRIVVSFTLCVLILFALMPMPALAVQPIDLECDCTLTIEYKYVDDPIEGATFHVYRVADVSQSGNVTGLCGDFSGYPVDVVNLADVERNAVALTLYGYALVDNLQPEATVTIDKNGFAEVTGLKPGLYLVAGKRWDTGTESYTTSPFLVRLPASVDSEESWDYLVIAQPKIQRHSQTSEDPVSRKVLKVWEDDGRETFRPVYIEVCLLRNGEVYDIVKLDEDSDWRYSWTRLSSSDEWMIVEKTPKGYTVLNAQMGVTTLITNTYEDDGPSEPTEPSESTEPTKPSDATEPSEPSKSTEPTDSTKPTTPSKPQLPQTGMLWWPVPLLVALGLVLIVVGCVLRKGERYDA